MFSIRHAARNVNKNVTNFHIYIDNFHLHPVKSMIYYGQREELNMKKIKVGVLGGFRGTSMINYCKAADNAEIVAICDNQPAVIEAQKKNLKGCSVTFYDDFNEFYKA